MAWLRRKKKAEDLVAPEPEIVAKALAKAIADGDIVNFRLLFMPFSPARGSETEFFDSPKYAYLLPGQEEETYAFREILKRVQERQTWAHIQQELKADRPARLPSELLMLLADNAVRLGKYTSAAQAYELLRVRGRMQEEFYRQAEAALDAKNFVKAARGYLIASGLEYNYAAFPEPLPLVPDFQKRALMLHGEYPQRPEDSLPMQEASHFLRMAFSYLLLSPHAAAALEERPLEVQVGLLNEIVRQRDPGWGEFLQRYHDACHLAQDIQQRLQHILEEGERSGAVLAENMEAQLGGDPMRVTAMLLGRVIQGGAWWQYLKELAYVHPASILFLARQLVGGQEILVPRYRTDSPIPAVLGLTAGSRA